MPSIQRSTACALLVLSLVMGPCFPVAAGDLANVGKKVRSSSGKKEATPRPHDHDCNDDDSVLGNLFVELLGPPVLAVCTSPWWGPNVAIEGVREPDSVPDTVDFPLYPYESNHDGYLLINGPVTENFNTWGGQAEFDYGNDFSGMQRIGTHLLWEHHSRFGLDAEASHWIEEVAGGGHDNAWSGDANLIVRFAQSEKICMRSGIGVNWFEIDGKGDAGFNFTYGADIFPVKPLVLKTVLDAGNVGNAGLLHLRGTVGVQLNRVELFTGYDFRRVGGTSLQGWLSGVTLWF